MTAADTRATSRPAPIAAAMHDVVAAAHELAAAKQEGLAHAIGQAQHDMQAAVDVARDLGVEWSQIGDALGIARGNAYQRFRRKRGRPAVDTLRYLAL